MLPKVSSSWKLHSDSCIRHPFALAFKENSKWSNTFPGTYHILKDLKALHTWISSSSSFYPLHLILLLLTSSSSSLFSFPQIGEVSRSGRIDSRARCAKSLGPNIWPTRSFYQRFLITELLCQRFVWYDETLVGTCYVQFETGETFGPTSPYISIVLWPAKRSATMLRPFAWNPNNVGLVKMSAHTPCNIFFKTQTIVARFLLSGLL